MKPGSVLAGKYRLDSMLGSGGMGAVWRAEHLGLRAPVAIKLLAPELDGRQDALARFLREAQSAASLRSPHVVQVLDHGVDETTQTPFIAMELMEGESLADRLTRVVRLSPAETSRIITQTARALNRAHELGIIHRDLKPANLFLVRNEDDEILKVLDFGLAKWRRSPGALTQGAATATNIVMGTPYYMSPEQMNGSRDADQRSDLWALGVIAFECLSGTRPFDGDNLIALGMKVCTAPTPALSHSLGLPPEFDAWFARALAKDPAHRFQTARELAEELRRISRVDGVASASWQPQPSAAPPLAAAPPAVVAHEVIAAGVQTAPLVQPPLEERPAPTVPVNDGDATSENARSASPVARSIGTNSGPVRAPRRGRPLLWAGTAGIAVSTMAVIGMVRSRPDRNAETAVQDRTSPRSVESSLPLGTASSLPPRAAEPSEAHPRSRDTEALTPPEASATEVAPVVVPVPQASSGTAPPSAKSASPVSSNKPAVKPSISANEAIKVPPSAPTRRPTQATSSSSAKGVDIERKPSF
ncbi:MAG TPA: protein kinase [Polyangiaceae bacterium]|nr:protein kinase [Polyangiaceae bacterium]